MLHIAALVRRKKEEREMETRWQSNLDRVGPYFIGVLLSDLKKISDHLDGIRRGTPFITTWVNHWNNITPLAEGHWKIIRPRAKHYVARGPHDAARGP